MTVMMMMMMIIIIIIIIITVINIIVYNINSRRQSPAAQFKQDIVPKRIGRS